jgi:hypothetical protein
LTSIARYHGVDALGPAPVPLLTLALGPLWRYKENRGFFGARVFPYFTEPGLPDAILALFRKFAQDNRFTDRINHGSVNPKIVVFIRELL